MNVSRAPVLLLVALAAAFLISPAAAADSLPLGAEGRLTGDLVATSVCGYLLGTNDLTLDEVSDAAYVYAVWGGEPKTVTDMTGRKMTLYRPVERIITNNPDNSRLVIAYGDGHLLVGSDECTIDSGCVCPMTADGEIFCEECWEGVTPGGLENLALTNDRYTPNYEQMVSLKPDLVFLWMSWEDQADDMVERVGAPVFVAGPDFTYESVTDHTLAVGEALSKEGEAEELVAFMNSKIRMVTDITDAIPEDEKVRVYFAPRGAKKGFYDAKEGRDFTRTYNTYFPLDMAGGVNVAEDCADGNVNVAIEQIIAWNPDVILVSCSTPDDAGVDFILAAPELQSIKAIQEGRVYNVFYPHCRGRPQDRNLLNVLYMARILYPDKFADLDMEQEGNEIMTAFLGVDGVYSAYADYLTFPRDQQI
ncbi:iron ABC transporter substrate-binding protein [Methanoculleus sp. FWC-SCC1]|uniref:Iron ABC transporter substrate-binding protein n=1 Tax=Methanoculleus frigidifontis TaxID=2584085 RepID=A0ABT8MAK9_9EURY|nr:ABC transporter substrate-binding protein [Methanoculleus sp. FWC-SCC1]MDN7024972.1 iron ABC transporter substrate-binding protein [Methanoculleus sp. FWC-SCC1]